MTPALSRRNTFTLTGAFLGSLLMAQPVLSQTASTEIAAEGVVGVFHADPSMRARTAVIMLNGSDGGVPPAMFARDLAEAGFPTLALAWLQDAQGQPDDVPRTGPVPLELLFRAIDWLERRPEAAPGRIVLMGVSRGAELALLTASLRPDVAGVVAFSPGAHVWGGVSSPQSYVFDVPMWSLNGEGLPYQAHRPDLALPIREWFARAPDDAAAALKVERINGPILLLSSRADGIWPASRYADQLEDRLRERGFPHRVFNLQYEDASHLMMGFGPAPTRVRIEEINYTWDFGGTDDGTLVARNAAWAETKAFLARIGR